MPTSMPVDYSETRQEEAKKTDTKAVGYWLLATGALTFGIVILGGLTRLTESGLSITEWNLIRGMKWPSNTDEWNVEFDKYKQTPEYKM
jgi:cytochrome c oxidase assembly protein subunit 15